MPDYDGWVKATLVSFLLADVILLHFAHMSRTASSFRLSLGRLLALAIAFYAGCAMLDVMPRWPARMDRDRFLAILLPLTFLVEVVSAFASTPRWLGWLMRLSLAGAAAPILLYQSVYVADLSGPDSAEWSTAQRFTILAGLAALLAGVWSLLAWLQKRTGDGVPMLALALSSLAASLSVMLSGSVTSGLPALPLAGALAGAALASFFAPALPSTNCCLGVGVIGLFSVLMSGRFFAELPTETAMLVLLAPLLAWLPESPGVRRLPLFVRAAGGLALVAVPLVLAVVKAKLRFDQMAESL